MKEQAYERERERMVERQLRRRGIVHPQVLQAMLDVPRHRFVPPPHQDLAYRDSPLPIGYKQTISQPYIVALMTQLLHLKGGERVLEVGTGSGYQAAILSRIAGEVVSLERLPVLAERARRVLDALGYTNIEIIDGDGSTGEAASGMFDGILVTAAAPEVPEPLTKKLIEGGRLVIPVGSRCSQVLQVWQREGGKLNSQAIAPVAFVPLLGRHGWDDDAPPD